MKPDKLSELLQNIDKNLIARAAKRRNKNRTVIIRAVAFAACLAIIVTGGVHAFILSGDNGAKDPVDSGTSSGGGHAEDGEITGSTMPSDTNSVVAGGSDTPQVNSGAVKKLGVAVYPEQVPYPTADPVKDDETYDQQFKEWWQAKQKASFDTDATGNKEFVKKLIKAMLEDNGENIVFSPANIYFSLATLAEITGGNSQKQILSLVGKEDITSLRENSSKLWQKMYSDDGRSTTLLANSVWLKDSLDFNKNTIDILKNDYFSSTFSGNFLSADYQQAFKNWLSEQTRGLLDEQIKDIEFGDETSVVLSSAVYFKDAWMDGFVKSKTETGAFHAPDGDAFAEFMNNEPEYKRVYYSDSFTALGLRLCREEYSMDFILPDENCTVSDVLKDNAAVEYITGNLEALESKNVSVKLSVPKFDISNNIDLKESFSKLGMTDILDGKLGDFSGIYTDGENRSIESSEHAVRLRIDEDGVEGAAYVNHATTDGMPPEDGMDFVLDRPFIFVVRGVDDLPHFVGIVNTP